MRYSKQRELVLQKVEELCDHPTAEESFDKAAPECPGLSLGTVYRNATSLADACRARRVCIRGKGDRFEHTLPWLSHLYSSSFCGVTGIKPTYGTVSRYGLIAYGSSLDQIGPVAKDVTDCATILETIASHDPKESTSVKGED